MIKIKIIIIKNPKHTKLWSYRISRGIEKKFTCFICLTHVLLQDCEKFV